MFGANKTGFGASTSNTGSSLFAGGTGGGTQATGFGATSTGFGASGAVGDPPGTGTTPFQAYTEKEPNSTLSNSFQNVLFQDPYKKWSVEELRLVDYAQGRRHGNASGAGAFGVGSNFGGGFGTNNQQATAGGFGSNTGNTGGGLFGNNANNASNPNTGFGSGGFGASNTNTNTGGGLFGSANKTGGGLFGNNTQTQQSGGGLFAGGSGGFGASNTTANTGFGQQANTATPGGGLFGNNQQANKPAGTGFSFGNTGSNTGSAFGGGNTAGGFGAAANTTGGGGLFGNTGNAQSAGGGLFGGSNTQQQNTGTGFGGGFGQQNQTQQSGGLFGNNQQKPATGGGLFGGGAATATSGSGGLFGNNPQQQQQQGTGGGLFGSTNNASAGGGLFGGNKPSTGGGLFGGGNTQATGGTSLFRGNNQQQQQATGGGLFGASTNQQKPGGLFGATTQSSGGGLFGGQNQTQGSSFFGGASQQQGQVGLGSSMLGSSQQANNVPQGLTANLNDVSAYGSPSLFTGLGGNEVSNPGPLATPLNGNSKPRKSSILPMYKLAPATAASRFATPQKRGFGFSYSSYGTPGGSPASSISSTPGGMGRSLLGSGATGSLSKSISASNLRRSFNTEDSILAPGAFSSSSNSRWYGSTGSKKLIINRDIRSDLFNTPQKDKPTIDSNTSARKLNKRVSFDTAVDADDATPARQSLPAPEDTPNSQTEETPRQTRSSSSAMNGSKTPEMEQVKGNELAIVHEEDTSVTPEAAQAPLGFDNAPGEYWMEPSRDELQNMNRMQRQRIDNFTVGRDNVGFVKFKIPVDISTIELDDLCGGIIQLEPRSATVYPVQAKKPPVGKGLNVPAQICLEQSWPRGGRDKRIASDPKRFNKHVERLKRIPDTTFESYDKDTGVWIFGVEHFTTYGLDDSDEESDEEMGPPPQTALETQPNRQFVHQRPVPLNFAEDAHVDEQIYSPSQRNGLPGAFDEQDEIYDVEDASKPSFLGVSSADLAPNNVRLALEDDYASAMGDEYDMSEDEDMTRSSFGHHPAAELDDDSSENDRDTKQGTPGGILRARMRAMKDSVGPVTLEVADGDDWMEMLRKTVSPAKRDRQLLRELIDSPLKHIGGGASTIDDDNKLESRKSSIWGRGMAVDRASGLAAGKQLAADKGRGFATSIDLMNSLFEKPKPTRQNLRASVTTKGFPQVGSPVLI